ncbi:glycosyltransferase family 9 protein [Saccharicrinis sp. FJH54]|uniref:glycosyltransferase family 9 protein n=1 Tax=Saccharicrinis sp. FJH54 TaxID=3344665 RepID=UPI0035D4B3CB
MKILIIRFSSIGDVIQCMSVTSGFHRKYDNPQIHWITRTDMASILKTDPHIYRVWDFDREDGLFGLIRMARALKKEKFDLIYDAHLNIRSYTVRFVLNPLIFRFFKNSPKVIVRKKHRFNRFLFFSLGKKDAIPQPFRGMISFQKPLRKLDLDFSSRKHKNWLFPKTVTSSVDALLSSEQFSIDEKTITIIPSAAWELKRWPLEHWKQLVEIMPEYKFIVVAGPDDTFTKEIADIAPDRVLNLAGRTNLNESFYLVKQSNFIVSADTGFLHAADLFGKDGIAFMGPTAFGHTTGESIKVLEIDLPCRPCSKEGNSECKIAEIKKCLFDITPRLVKKEIEKTLQIG